MAREISTNGRKKVSTLMKEFNANFPYIYIYVCTPDSKELVQNGKAVEGVDFEKTLSQVRTKKGNGEISFTGSKNVRTIEKEFENIFGLYVQICYTSKEGNKYYTNGSDDNKSLSQLNREKGADGCLKGRWKG